MRFFFDLTYDGICHVDRTGMHLPDIEAARCIVIRKATDFVAQSTASCASPHRDRSMDVTVRSGGDVITRCTFVIR